MEKTYTLSEAAEVTGKSRVTLRRYLDQGRFPNAYRDEKDPNSQPWHIPAADLRAAGLTPSTDPAHGASLEGGPEAALRTELAVAQALAEERAHTIELLSAQLLQIQDTLRAVAAPR